MANVHPTIGVSQGNTFYTQSNMGNPLYPPINFFYTHFHNAIRGELESLAKWVRDLEPAATGPAQQSDVLGAKLQELRERYRFLEQIYKYHSSVEDEVGAVWLPSSWRRISHVKTYSMIFWQVVYPALDSKVKNVTLAYSVEHQDEVTGTINAAAIQFVSRSCALTSPCITCMILMHAGAFARPAVTAAQWCHHSVRGNEDRYRQVIVGAHIALPSCTVLCTNWSCL